MLHMGQFAPSVVTLYDDLCKQREREDVMPCHIHEPIIMRTPEEWDELRKKHAEHERAEDKKKRAKFAKEDGVIAFADWVGTGDKLTHQLDMMREQILAGGKLTNTSVDTMNKLVMKLIVSWDGNSRKRGLKRAHEKLLRQRDVVMAFHLGAGGDLMNVITADQVEHRGEDISRVVSELESRNPAEGCKDWERLAAAKSADVTKPLIPQLGFDPDDV